MGTFGGKIEHTDLMREWEKRDIYRLGLIIDWSPLLKELKFLTQFDSDNDDWRHVECIVPFIKKSLKRIA